MCGGVCDGEMQKEGGFLYKPKGVYIYMYKCVCVCVSNHY